MDPSYQGRWYPPGEPFQVGRESVRDFAAAVGARAAVHVDLDAAQQAGYADLLATPTYAVVIAQRCAAAYLNDPHAGIDLARIVHAHQEFRHHRPLVAGDEVLGTLHVERVRPVGDQAMITTRCELALTDGTPVSTVGATLVVRGHRPAQDSDVVRSAPAPSSGEVADGPPVGAPVLGKVRVGQQFPITRVSLDRARLVQYAAASGDRHPIHWDEQAAAAADLPDVVAHGMLTMGIAGEIVSDWVGDGGSVISYHARFPHPLPVPREGGAVIDIAGQIVTVDEDNATAVVELSVTNAAMTGPHRELRGQRVLGRPLLTVRLDTTS